MRIGFFTNIAKDIDKATTRELIRFVRDLGCEAIEFATETVAGVDFLVVLGGDGTMLQAASRTVIHSIPLLGINLGKVGYLADVEKSQAKNAIQMVLAGNYQIQERMMLSVNVAERRNFALNDIVVHRGACARMIECAVKVDGEHVDIFRSDGLIVATPTGSTAYNFAAGGPVLKPDAQMVIVTPICPQSPSVRPVVVSVDNCVEICVSHPSQATISFDGVILSPREVARVTEGGFSIIIHPNDYRTQIIKTNSLGFYEILRMKMKKV
ncbi:MAG: NAD(+)/NADH kinase [Clostridiales bacterium]|jgi:NAD+ kinase|nr:NAD(+)/NADH kinase [Clostridiales bacterium]